MQIYTFYSFKGGVGRSNLLYNVAYLLAAKHRARVVISDWDLHAPGMTCLYDMQDPDGPLLRRGIVDVLSDLADELKADADQITDPMDLVHPTRIGRRIQEADPDAGDIWFLPAGAFADEDMGEYRNKVHGLREGMPELVKRGRKELLPWVAERIEARFANEKKKPDYLLLDARTGLTEVGDLLVSKATSRVILVFGLNDQNIDGMGHTLRWILDDVGPANIASHVLLVVSPVPNGEEHVKQQRRRRIDDVVTAIVNKASELAGLKKPVAPERLEVPYHPLIALTERPMAEVYPQSEPVKAFEAVTERLRTRPLKAEAVQQEIQLRVREEQLTAAGGAADKKAPEAMRASLDDTHPMARNLPWNVVHPKATPDLLLRTKLAEGDELLDGFANTLSLGMEELSKIIEQVPKLTALQRRELLRTFAEERAHFMAMGKNQWPGVALLRAHHWVDWVFDSARRLDVASDVAGQRLVDWLSSSSGGTMNLVLVAAVAGEMTKRSDVAGVVRSLLERAVEANPGDATFLVQAASQRIAMGDVERGNEWFQQTAERSEPRERVEGMWAFALQERAERVSQAAPEEALRLYAAAETHYARAVEQEPDKHEGEYNWGTTIAARARLLHEREPNRALQLFEEAEQHYRRALELKPDQHEAENNWGNAIAARAQLLHEREPDRALQVFEEAEQHYRRALELKPDKHEAEYNWGNAIAARARLLHEREPPKALQLFEEAERHYRRALEIKADEHEAEINWGNAIAERAKLLQEREPDKTLQLLEEAERHYRRALEVKPDRHDATGNLVGTLCSKNHVLRALGHPDDAARAAKEALRLALDHSKTIGKPTYNLACTLAQNGDVEQAFTTLESLARNGELDDDPAWMRKDPDLAPLRADPRFDALLKKLETR